jgi:hypothetical protein
LPPYCWVGKVITFIIELTIQGKVECGGLDSNSPIIEG